MRSLLASAVAMALAGCGGDRPGSRASALGPQARSDSGLSSSGSGPSSSGPGRAEGRRPTAETRWTTDLDPAVTPLAQRLDLDLDPDAADYRGVATIDLHLAEPRRQLWLHSVGLTLLEATVESGGQRWAMRILPARGETVGFDAARTIAAGPARLILRFRGDYREGDGIFWRKARARGYVFSDFEPTDARRGFPCFDEPRFKVPWTISILAPRAFRVFSNAPQRTAEPIDERRHRVTFDPTPPLPSYLVAFAVGPFDVVEISHEPVPLRLIVPSGRQLASARARAAIARMVTATQRIVDRPLPNAKLDFIAIPGFHGAMENPGLITMSAEHLLDPPWPGAEHLLSLFIAHEVAHQWYGNQTTIADWRDLWLNESLATWLADRALASAHPDGRHRALELDDKWLAIDEDDVAGTRPVWPASAPQPWTLFDAITYQKGAAILHMLESWLGNAALDRALSAYLDAHLEKPATTPDLIAALAAIDPALPIDGVLRSFVAQPGVPRIEGTVRCDRGRATVELAAPAPPRGPRFVVPVCLASDGGTAPRCAVVETTASLELASCPRWTSLAAGGRGYYTWSMPAAEMAALVTAPGASEVERLDALRQLEPAVLAGALDGNAAAAVASAAVERGTPAVAALGLEVIALLRDQLAPTAAARALPAMRRRLHQLGRTARRGEPAAHQSLRGALLTAVGLAGDAPTVRWARRAAARWFVRFVDLDDVQAAAFAIAAAHGDEAVLEAILQSRAMPTDRQATALARVPAARAAETIERMRGQQVEVYRQLVARLLRRADTELAAVTAIEGDTALAALVADQPTCNRTLQAKVTAAARAGGVDRPLDRPLARSEAWAAACEAARTR